LNINVAQKKKLNHCAGQPNIVFIKLYEFTQVKCMYDQYNLRA